MTKKTNYLLLIIFLLVTIPNMIWWYNYKNTSAIADNLLGERLKATAVISGLFIPPDLIAESYISDSAYLELITFLGRIKTADLLSEVFILRENYKIIATTSFEDDSLYLLSDLNGVYIDSILYTNEEISLATPTYKSGEIFLKTAFAPIVSSEGYVIAVLGVEASVNYFGELEQIRNNLIYSGLISIIAGLFFGLLIIIYHKQISKAEYKLHLNETHSYLGRMVAVVSHEIKNPLMIIRASAERILKKNNQPEAQFVVEEVDRLNEIVSGYLNFASSEADSLILEKKEKIELGDFVDNLQKHINSNYPEQTIIWELIKPQKPAEITTYPRVLRQVLLNLLINGVESCLTAAKPVKIGIAVELNKQLKFVVTDQGTGIKKSDMKHIFEPFYTTKTGGSGIGLYLSKKIITSLGGNILLNSKSGKTEFILNIPI